MLRIVLPGTAAAAIACSAVALRIHLVSVATVYLVSIAAVNVGIPVEVIVDVDVHVVVAPTTAPTPSTAPHGAHRDTHAERNCHACGVITWGRIVNRRVWINGRAIHDDGVVGRNVNDFGVRLLDDDHFFLLDNLGLYFLLVARFQVARLFGFFPHALHGFHHVSLLGKEGIPQVRRPLDVVRKPFCHVRQSRQRLHAGVPRLFCHRIGQGFVFQVFVLC